MSTVGEGIKRKAWSFFSGSQFSFGPGAVTQLAGVIRRRQSRRVLIVSDGVLERNGLVGLVKEVVDTTEADCKLFCEGEPEPSSKLVDKLREEAKEYRPDLWIALGGGSNMDLAKAEATRMSSKQV